MYVYRYVHLRHGVSLVSLVESWSCGLVVAEEELTLVSMSAFKERGMYVQLLIKESVL